MGSEMTTGNEGTSRDPGELNDEERAAIFAAANIVIAIVSPSTRVSQPEAVEAAELEPANA